MAKDNPAIDRGRANPLRMASRPINLAVNRPGSRASRVKATVSNLAKVNNPGKDKGTNQIREINPGKADREDNSLDRATATHQRLEAHRDCADRTMVNAGSVLHKEDRIKAEKAAARALPVAR